MFTKVAIILAVAAQALAVPFITAPIASTTFSGGQNATIRWQDNGSAPSAREFGPSRISIYVGNAQQQTSLQVINPSVDVGLNNTLTFVVDPAIGPDSSEYFIRIESLALRDPAQPQYPALAFSAKFTLDEMTGTFTPAIQSQIAGQATAPLASQPTSTGTGTTTTPPRTTPPAASNTPAANSNTDDEENDENSAVSARAGYAAVVFGAIVAGAVLF